MAIFNSYNQLPEGRPYFNNLSMPSVPQKPIGKVTPHKSPQESGIGLVMEGFHPHPNGKKNIFPVYWYMILYGTQTWLRNSLINLINSVFKGASV